MRNKKNIKCTLVQALRLCTGRTAHRGSRGIALPFHDHGIRRGWGVSVTLRPLFTPWKDAVPIVQEAGWAPGPVWTGAENLAPTGIRSQDRPTRSHTDYATLPTKHTGVWWKSLENLQKSARIILKLDVLVLWDVTACRLFNSYWRYEEMLTLFSSKNFGNYLPINSAYMLSERNCSV